MRTAPSRVSRYVRSLCCARHVGTFGGRLWLYVPQHCGTIALRRPVLRWGLLPHRPSLAIWGALHLEQTRYVRQGVGLVASRPTCGPACSVHRRQAAVAAVPELGDADHQQLLRAAVRAEHGSGHARTHVDSRHRPGRVWRLRLLHGLELTSCLCGCVDPLLVRNATNASVTSSTLTPPPS